MATPAAQTDSDETEHERFGAAHHVDREESRRAERGDNQRTGQHDRRTPAPHE